jgi:hypothetical protein
LRIVSAQHATLRRRSSQTLRGFGTSPNCASGWCAIGVQVLATGSEYVAHHNKEPKPFIWTKSARDILQKVIRANSRLSSKQNATLR